MLLAMATLVACSPKDEAEPTTKTEQDPLAQPKHLESVDSSLEQQELGTDREGIEEKDLDKKSADFDPDEVKLGKENE